MQAARGNVQGVVTQVQERVQRLVGDQPNVPTAASVTTGWAAAGNELLSPKGGHSIAAVATLNPDFYAIDEHSFKNQKMRAPLRSPFGAGVALNLELRNNLTF
jgi:hypothetical protein